MTIIDTAEIQGEQVLKWQDQCVAQKETPAQVQKRKVLVVF